MRGTIEPLPGEPGWDDYARRVGPTPDAGYSLYSAPQPGQPQGSTTDVTGDDGADLGYRAGTHDIADGWHSHPHAAFGEAGADDGMHEHEHQHVGERDHNHPHDDGGQGFLPWAPQVSSSGRRGTSPRERAAFLARMDRPGFGAISDEVEASDDPFPELGLAERAHELAEQDLHEARTELGEAHARCQQDGTVGYFEGDANADKLEGGSERERSASRFVPPVTEGRALSPAARSRLATFQQAEARAQHAQAAYDAAAERQSRALADWHRFVDEVGLRREPGPTGGIQEVLYADWQQRSSNGPRRAGRRTMDPQGDGLGRIDRDRPRR